MELVTASIANVKITKMMTINVEAKIRRVVIMALLRPVKRMKPMMIEQLQMKHPVFVASSSQ